MKYTTYTIVYSEVKPKRLDIKAFSHYQAFMMALDMFNIPEEQIIQVTSREKEATD